MCNINFQKAAAFILVLFLFSGLSNKVTAQEEYEEWKEQYLKEFQEFQNKYDKQFHKMLQEEWGEFDIEVTPDFYQKPKFDVIPSVEEEEKKGGGEKEEEKTEETVSLDKADQEPQKSEKKDPETVERENQDYEPTEKEVEKSEPVEQKEMQRDDQIKSNEQKNLASASLEKGLSPSFEPKVKKAEVQTNSLNYFDIPIRYKYYSAYKTRMDRPIDKKAISDFWKHLSTKDYPSFMEQIQQVRKRLSLNDYGYAQLLKDIGNQIYGKDTHEATLFTWFMLTQSGFDTRIAYNKGKVFLLLKTNPGIFSSYFTIDGSKYYRINFDKSYSELPGQLYTYGGNYPKSELKELNLLFSQLPVLSPKKITRTLSFTYRDTSYSLEIPIDKNTINYLRNYPQGDLKMYFTSRMNSETHKKLISSLRPLLEGKSTVEKVNLLMRFVQKSVDYKTDQEQFNEEKKMFPAEALFYPYSDCDDRTILLGYLIEHLTDLEYIAIRYPGHLTLAVHFPDNPPSGPRVNKPIATNGKSFYVTDATYFGSSAGMIAPDYQNAQTEVVFTSQAR